MIEQTHNSISFVTRLSDSLCTLLSFACHLLTLRLLDRACFKHPVGDAQSKLLCVSCESRLTVGTRVAPAYAG